MIQSLKIIIKKASSYRTLVERAVDKTSPKTVTSKRRTNKTRMKDIGMPIALASGLGSAIAEVVTIPVDVAKVRLQVSGSSAATAATAPK
eukprot:gene8355-12380_t